MSSPGADEYCTYTSGIVGCLNFPIAAGEALPGGAAAVILMAAPIVKKFIFLFFKTQILPREAHTQGLNERDWKVEEVPLPLFLWNTIFLAFKYMIDVTL